MNITKSGRIAAALIIPLITISVPIIMVSLFNKNKEFMEFISLGVTTGSLYSHQIYIKLINKEDLKDTLDIIVSNEWLANEIRFDKKIKTSDPDECRKFDKQFLNQLAYCIQKDQPMEVSTNVFNELKKYIFVIDKNIEKEFNSNGLEHYIDEDGCLKGYKWDPKDSIPNPPLVNDSARINRLKNLIHLIQKEGIGGVYSYQDDEAPDYWGYAVWRY